MKIAGAIGMMATLATVAVPLSPTAFADDDAGWYVGFNAGQSRATIDDGRIAAGLLGDGFTTTSINDDNSHFGFKESGGQLARRSQAPGREYRPGGQPTPRRQILAVCTGGIELRRGERLLHRNRISHRDRSLAPEKCC